ncbi:5'-3' exonuclease [Mycoplasma haemocanis str. Illinois]|uniref:5'-3' exonuclease n=1 Tax=Mycoplasma haemocanis (strain Illinois) TaxID=1111676 RepID=H6N5H7_MYCHN|nr:5'-3' exonuclease [Mycoplasma haemocanis]AEW44937.1 5'-3' exonuclease [Mycoplasma haemocanis str. Illinois]
MSKELAVIIDGNAFIYKAYFASQAELIKNKKTDEEISKFFGRTIQAVLNMCKPLLLKKDYKYAVVVFDSSKKTFRQEKFQNYKANRASMPHPLLKGLDDIKSMLNSLGFRIVNAPQNYEGDDVICTLSHLFHHRAVLTDIFSTDRDLLQLVTENITVNILRSKGLPPQEYKYEEFSALTGGLSPSQIPQLKAMAGDSSDNYGGIPGIGSKTAMELLKKYSTIDNIYENLDQLPDRISRKFVEHKKTVDLFLEISTTVKDIEISQDLDSYVKNKVSGDWK